MFEAEQLLPGVWHCKDAMGVCMTLLVGSERGLLVDTGYGLEDVAAWVRSITDKPVEVLLTHGHHDHALGARWFPQVHIFPEDMAVYRTYTTRERREKVAGQARDKGLTPPEDFLTAGYPTPAAAVEGTIDLGGLHARIIHQPGHTPGSAMVLVPEHGLLLTGDDWNPCTWLFFPEALPVKEYLAGMRRFFRENEFSRVLCSHQPVLFDRSMPERFLEALTEDALRTAVHTELWPTGDIDPCRVDADETQYLVFDRLKL